MENLKINTSGLLKAAPLAALAAVVINAVLFFIGSSAGIMDPSVGAPKPDGSVEPITIVPVIMASILPVIVGALLLALLNRFTANPLRIFGIIAIVFTALSLAGPFTAFPMPTGMSVLLDLMHIVVAGSVWYFFSRIPRAA